MTIEEYTAPAREIVKQAEALMILAGAGMGVDSGLPDFRGNEGFWKAYPPIARLGLSFTDMANPEWFSRKPELAWGFYGHRLNLYRKVKPHAGFSLLLEKGKSLPGGYFVFTSNVDGQFQKAGFEQEHIEEAHGSIHHLQCTTPCCSKIWPAEEFKILVDENTMQAKSELPLCPYCGSLARPNILMFSDWSWLAYRSNEQGDLRNKWLNQTQKQGHKLLLIEVGAGSNVPTVRMKSQNIARQFNANFIRINPREFDVPKGQTGLCGNALEILSAIL